jgi:Ubiquitin-2 like Rad60 SUMO-like
MRFKLKPTAAFKKVFPHVDEKFGIKCEDMRFILEDKQIDPESSIQDNGIEDVSYPADSRLPLLASSAVNAFGLTFFYFLFCLQHAVVEFLARQDGGGCSEGEQ